ncbi:MAG: GIY-YIG nuclease family protein [bacterium]|nr:GIY-YIG nuclease family protein [bacterium]
MFFVYILRNRANKLYIGQTNSLEKRIKQQDSLGSKAAKFIKDNQKFDLVYSEQFPTRIEAMRREKQLKGWTRAKKEALIRGDLGLLKQL